MVSLKRVLAVLTILLAGCMTNESVVEQSDSTVVRRIGVGWVRQAWRICEEGGACPQPTRKTIALAPRSPIQATPQPASRSQEAKEVERRRFRVHFGYAMASPTQGGQIELENVLSRIRENDSIQIQGHTDDVGSIAFNDRLARQRAWFVATWLKRRGVANPMEVKARGKCCYVAANDSDEGRAANRRVVVILDTTVKKETRR